MWQGIMCSCQWPEAVRRPTCAPHPTTEASVYRCSWGEGTVIGTPWESHSILPHWLVGSWNHSPNGMWRSQGWQAWDQRSLKRCWNLRLWRRPRGTSGAKDSIWPRSDANSCAVAQSLWSKEDRRDCRRYMWWESGKTNHRRVSKIMPRNSNRCEGLRSDFSSLREKPKLQHRCRACWEWREHNSGGQYKPVIKVDPQVDTSGPGMKAQFSGDLQENPRGRRDPAPVSTRLKPWALLLVQIFSHKTPETKERPPTPWHLWKGVKWPPDPEPPR